MKEEKQNLTKSIGVSNADMIRMSKSIKRRKKLRGLIISQPEWSVIEGSLTLSGKRVCSCEVCLMKPINDSL